ncbi:methyl-accepting chemotaxis protein [Psychrosphaera sp. 1_MG-2023]|uniref:methyl-accepting chemotaxis protein n=1 Tax=Psychrosphaera sp. 1_MG-2023 TaxID=3062643 RepID=UPI0026E2BCBE|nr:methyl-accepting chemotaxis protein [Psychrosphaera sp. 1_MG-2023]MDO6719704.1 methyl-accepting chemotaxis protein [Psychrosphaera sp. 1_MG-2023]
MTVHSIRFKYTAAFGAIALFLILLVAFYNALISKTESALDLFGKKFNPAISAVLNADRDLYQARVAEQLVLLNSPNSESAKQAFVDYQDNAQQALDRMNKYKSLLQAYPEILAKLSGFEPAYKTWLQESGEVFELVSKSDVYKARDVSAKSSLVAFEALRSFYDIAGEEADKMSKFVSSETVDSVANQQSVLLTISLIIVCGMMTIGYIGPKFMSNSLITLRNQIDSLNSGDGDLTQRLNSKRHDEIGDVENSLDQFVNDLAKLISSIVGQSSKVIEGVGQMDGGAKRVQEISQEQSESVEQIATSVNEMSYAIKEVAENAHLTADELQQVTVLTEEGTRITESAVTEISNLSDTVANAAEVIIKLSENSADIASVLDVIRGIAEQTNLLALNAAIEAARAGEQGRGFAVVADEVRTLASKTQQSTENIQKMIENLQNGVEHAVESINAGSAVTESTVALSKQTLTALSKIAEASQKVTDVAAQTATATEEQSQVAQEISKYLTELADKTANTFEIASQNGERARNARVEAKQLSDSVSRFKLN